MKNSILAVFIWSVLPILAYCQTPYYDALLLSKLHPSLDSGHLIFPLGVNEEAAKILKNYTNKSTYPGIEESFRTNPFIRLPQITALSSNLVEGVTKSPISTKSGLNVTSIADGLAKFLVDRTKQELSITFFQKFKDFLDSEKAKDFKTLFPNTKNAMDAIDKEIYQYASYLNTLRESFDKDLKNLLDRLPIVIEDRVSNPEKEYILMALYIVNQLKSGEHPASILENLATHQFSDNLKPLEGSLKFFRIISTSIKSKLPDQYWVSSDSLSILFQEPTFKIYLGLLYQLYGEEEINEKKFKIYLNDLANAFDSTYKKYQDVIKNIGASPERVNLAINEIKRKKDAGEKIDSYFSLFNSSIAFLETLSKINDLAIGITLGDEVKKLSRLASLTSNLYLDINERKYNAAVVDLSILLNEILQEKYTWNDELIRYGTFIANVAQAETSDEVQAAIEAVALPVGSASIKRKSKSNISLNAYVGLSPGVEYNGETEEWKSTFGVNTPVGIAFSWGHYKVNNVNGGFHEKGSSSIFLSLVDIAAFSTFRFNDSETEELPEVTLVNIFAPGVYYIYGIAKIPLSLGLGGQLGPEVRKLQPDVIPISTGLNVSIRFFLAVDIPLMNFYTKSR